MMSSGDDQCTQCVSGFIAPYTCGGSEPSVFEVLISNRRADVFSTWEGNASGNSDGSSALPCAGTVDEAAT